MATAIELLASRLKNHTPGLPPNVSICNCEGRSGRIVAALTGQCAKSKSCQLCAITHVPAGNGQGRCAASCRTELILSCKTFSTSPFSEYTLPLGPRIELLLIQRERKNQKERNHAAQSIRGLAGRLERWQGLDFDGQWRPEADAILLQHAL